MAPQGRYGTPPMARKSTATTPLPAAAEAGQAAGLALPGAAALARSLFFQAQPAWQTQWQAQCAAAATAWACEAMHAGLLFGEQATAHAGQWLATNGQRARDLAATVEAASRRATLATEPSAWWGAQWELLNQAVQASSQSAQEAWATVIEQQTRLVNA
jgi:hypothetical protein